jgi:hypothetical protein
MMINIANGGLTHLRQPCTLAGVDPCPCRYLVSWDNCIRRYHTRPSQQHGPRGNRCHEEPLCRILIRSLTHTLWILLSGGAQKSLATAVTADSPSSEADGMIPSRRLISAKSRNVFLMFERNRMTVVHLGDHQSNIWIGHRPFTRRAGLAPFHRRKAQASRLTLRCKLQDAGRSLLTLAA